MSTVDAAIIKEIDAHNFNKMNLRLFKSAFDDKYTWSKEGRSIKINTLFNWSKQNPSSILCLRKTDGSLIYAVPTNEIITLPDPEYQYDVRHAIHIYGDNGSKRLLVSDNGCFVITPEDGNNDEFEIPDNISTGVFKVEAVNPDCLEYYLLNIYVGSL